MYSKSGLSGEVKHGDCGGSFPFVGARGWIVNQIHIFL